MSETHNAGGGSSNTLLLTYEETGNTLRVSPSMVRKLARSGRLKAVHVGRTVRITQESILKLISGLSMEVENA